MKNFILIPAALFSFAMTLPAQAFDYQSLLNKGVQGAVTGAVSGESGKEVLKNTKADVTQEAQQQAQQSAAEMAKKAPTADTNPMGAIATDIAAQKAAQKAGGGTTGQVASDLVKGFSGTAQNKLMGQPTATPAVEATPVAATVTATTTTTSSKKKTSSKKSKTKKHK